MTNSDLSLESDLAWKMREHEARLLAELLRSSRLTLLMSESGAERTALLTGTLFPLLRRRARDVADDAVKGSRVVVPFPDRRSRTAGRSSARSAELVVYVDAWGGSPLHALRTSIQATVPPHAAIGTPKTRLADVLADLSQRLEVQFLIVLDRCDEFLNGALDATDNERFADELSEAINRPELRANFLLSMSEDSKPQLDDLRQRIRGFDDNCLRLHRWQNPAVPEATQRGAMQAAHPLLTSALPVLDVEVTIESKVDAGSTRVAAGWPEPSVEKSRERARAARVGAGAQALTRTEDVYAFIESSLTEMAKTNHCKPWVAPQAIQVSRAMPGIAGSPASPEHPGTGWLPLASTNDELAAQATMAVQARYSVPDDLDCNQRVVATPIATVQLTFDWLKRLIRAKP